ncbi:TPA: hypothetical protein HA242_04045 [Candidatus Woesearchaeota archaeon]|nr:hypothetical protein [Candidatus Woesearchaeota archaeon]
MSLAELEQEVRKVVMVGHFQEYARQQLEGLRGVERETGRGVLWLAVRNAREKMYSDAQQIAFGHHCEFQLHGARALQSEELLPINRELSYQTKPFREALETLLKYKPGGIHYEHRKLFIYIRERDRRSSG